MLVKMPFTPIAPVVADRVFDNSIIKQKIAPRKRLIIDELEDGSCTVLLQLQVQPYSLTAEGTHGQPLPADYPARPVPLVADNNTAVDPATGALRYIKVTESSAVNVLTQQLEQIPALEPDQPGSPWLAWLDNKPEPLALQGDHFAMVRDTERINLRELYEQHIRQADLMQKFA